MPSNTDPDPDPDDTPKTPWSDRAAACHEQFTTERNEGVRRELVSYIETTPVVEVGCGTAQLRTHIEPDGEYTGIDYTAEFEPDICANATALPLEENAVPTVVTKNCLQHIPDYEAAIAECCRVASERVIAVERVHDAETSIVATEPCLRQRFARDDLREAFARDGAVTIHTCQDDARLAIVVTDIETEVA